MMNRRDFLAMLGAGTLIPMLIPSVAEAFQLGKMSEDELFNLLTSDGGQGLIVQEAEVLAFDPKTRRYFRSGTAVKHHYQVTGAAEDREYQTDVWAAAEVPAYDLSDRRSLDGASILGGGPQMKRKVVAVSKSVETRKRKFIPGHQVNADGSAFVNPNHVTAPVMVPDSLLGDLWPTD